MPNKNTLNQNYVPSSSGASHMNTHSGTVMGANPEILAAINEVHKENEFKKEKSFWGKLGDNLITSAALLPSSGLGLGLRLLTGNGLFSSTDKQVLKFGAQGAKQVLSVGRAISDPINNINIPSEISMAELGMVLDLINPTSNSFVESMGYSPTASIFDVVARALVTKDSMKDILSDRQGQLERLNQEALANPNDVKKSETLAKMQSWIEARQDPTRSTIVSRGLDWMEEHLDDYIEYVGPVNTGNDKADYIIEGLGGVISSVLASVFTGRSLGGLIGKAAKTRRIATNPVATRILHGVGQASIAAAQTMGETGTVARDAYNGIIERKIIELSGEEYQRQIEKLVSQEVEELKQAGKTVSKNDVLRIQNAVNKELQNQWIQNNPQDFEKVKEIAMEGYHTATLINSTNLALNWLSSGLYLKGKFPSRDILKDPGSKRHQFFNRQSLTSGMNEYFEENVNTIAEHAANRVADGNRIFDPAGVMASKEGFESGFWGLVGGQGEASITQLTTLRQRRKMYEAQEKVIAEQNKLGAAELDMVKQMTTLGMTFSEIQEINQRINKYQAENNTEALKREADRLLTVQAFHAFETGTTENLIANYNKILKNENLTDEVKTQVKEALNDIKSLEKIYNGTLKYFNAESVRINRAMHYDVNKQILKEAFDNITAKANAMSELTNVVGTDSDLNFQSILEGNREGIDFNTEIGKRYQDALIKASQLASVKDFRRIESFTRMRDNLNKEYATLTSKEHQQSAYVENEIAEKAAKIYVQAEKEFRRQKQNRGKEFNPYTSNTYVRGVNSLIEKRKESLTTKAYTSLKEGLSSDIKLHSILNDIKAQDKISQTVINNDPGIEAIINDKVTDLDAVSDYSTSIKNDEESQVIFNDIKEAVQSIEPVQDELYKDELSSISDPSLQAAVQNAIEFGEEIGTETTDPKIISDHLSEEQKQNITNLVKLLYAKARQHNNSDPTFEDMILYMMAGDSVDSASRSFDMLKKGWKYAKLPKHDTTNFDEIYHRLFNDPNAVFKHIANLVDSLPEATSEQSRNKQNADRDIQVEQQIAKENNAPIEVDDNGNVFYEQKQDVVNNSDATLGFSTLMVKRNEYLDPVTNEVKVEITVVSKEIAISDRTPDHARLLDPDRYHEGTELNAVIPENYMNLPVNVYNSHGIVTGSMTFGQWLARENAIRKEKGLPALDETSPEYINKVPIMVRDSDNAHVANIRDVEHVSGVNNTLSTVEDGKKNTYAIREAAVKGKGKGATIIVRDKTLGHDDLKLSREDAKKLADIDPEQESTIAVMRTGNQLYFGTTQKRIPMDQIILPDKVNNIGFVYHIRKVGEIIIKDADGKIIRRKPKYYAFKNEDGGKLNNEHASTLTWLINAYLNKGKKGYDNADTINDIISKYAQLARKDLGVSQNVETLSELIKMFTKTGDIQATGNSIDERIANVRLTLVEKATKVGQRIPFIFTQDGKVVAGWAIPAKSLNKEDMIAALNEMDGKIIIDDKPVETAKSFRIGDPTNNAVKNQEFIDYVSVLLPNLSLNVSVGGLDYQGPVLGIKEDGTVYKMHNSYRDFIFNTQKNVYDSREIKYTDKDGKEHKKRVTFYQPTITVKLKGQEDAQLEQIAEPKVEETSSQKQEGKVFYDGKWVTTDEAFNLAQEKSRELDEELGYDSYLDDEFDPDTTTDPAVISDPDKDALILSQRIIKQLTITQQSQTTNFILYYISKAIDEENKGGKVNLEAVRKKAKEEFNKFIEKRKAHLESELARIQKLEQDIKDQAAAKGETFTGDFTDVFAPYKAQLNKIEATLKNWEVFEEVAINEAKKYWNLVDDNTITSLEDADPEIDELGEIATEEVTEKEKDFSKSALEVNSKLEATPEMKRFLHFIPEVDRDGKPVKGIFGMPVYVGFDTVWDTVQRLLAGSKPDVKVMTEILKTKSQGIKWLQGVVRKLESSDTTETTKNQFAVNMSKHALDMEFIMITKNRSGKYGLKIFNTNSGAITQALISQWRENIKASNLIKTVDGEYLFDLDGVNEALNDYEKLKGKDNTRLLNDELTKVIGSAIDNFIVEENKKVKDGDAKLSREGFFKGIDGGGRRKITVAPNKVNNLLELVKDNPFARVKIGKDTYQITHGGQYSFVISEYTPPLPSGVQLIKFLNNFGIDISPETADEIIKKGFKYDSRKPAIKFKDQFSGDEKGESVGLLASLAGALQQVKRTTGSKDIIYDEDETDSIKILDQTVIKALARMEAVNTPNRASTSFYDNGKSIYGLTASKFVTDRIEDLKKNLSDNTILEELLATSFNENSFWLDFLMNTEDFAGKFNVKHLGITAIKEIGKQLYREASLHKLPGSDIELAKLGFFMQLNQQLQKAPGTEKYFGLAFRTARMFLPTMSDKEQMILIQTAIMNINEAAMNNFDVVLDFMYNQLVEPEIKRMSSFYKQQSTSSTDVDAYGKGAKLFYFLPSLNNLSFVLDGDEVTLRSLTEKMSLETINDLSVTYEGKQQTVKEIVKNILNNYLVDKQQKKIQEWVRFGFVEDKDGKHVGTKFIDDAYIKSRHKQDVNQAVEIAAMDYVANSMLANANAAMVIHGDPAMMYKKEDSTREDDYLQIVDDTFVNVGKRLALLIAPRTKLADSENNRYYQLMLNDHYTTSDRSIYLAKLLDNKVLTNEELATIKQELKDEGPKFVKRKYKQRFPNTIDYLTIESTNAEEYTTWREHLYVLDKLGKLHPEMINVTSQEIREIQNAIANKQKLDDFTTREKMILSKILQPMKPVYTGQIHDKNQDIMRTVYIKTSSFPLIPQLTSGMEIDKLRIAMETLENNGEGMTVRASHQSGNKVGALTRPLNAVDQNDTMGDIDKMDAKTLATFSLVLPRSNFGIQQNVPFKSASKKVDLTSYGTQPGKLIFGNGVLNFSDFDFNGKKLTGIELYNEFIKTFDNLISTSKVNLYEELGINPITGRAINQRATNKKIERILRKEAILRGYPKQDLEAMSIDPQTGRFMLPLWISPSAYRYESLLMAIVTNRIVKMKFPGYSYVLGSETGFKFKAAAEESLEQNQINDIVFTDKFEGKLKPNQCFIPSKLRINGELVDLVNDVDENGKSKWFTTVNGRKILNSNVDPDLLSIPTFRIPTSKHSSMQELEIAGFLPSKTADLLIVSKDGTVSIGEDYDVDKRYTYHFWNTYEDGKIIPFHKSKKYADASKTAIERHTELSAANKQLVNSLQNQLDSSKEFKENFDELIYEIVENDDLTDLQKKAELLTLRSKLRKESESNVLNELIEAKKEERRLREDKPKLLQNAIISIHSAVMKHEEVQKMMAQKLSTDEAQKDAEFLQSISDQKRDPFFTPLSDTYQRNKIKAGSTHKIGTAAYSLDVVGHSLFEQALATGNPIILKKETDPDEEGKTEYVPFSIQFGSIICNDGVLGNKKTLIAGVNNRSGERDVADVISERQNLNVDGEKLQFASKLHLNEHTMKVDKILNFLGIDKGEDGRGISALFISQPIIVEYVRMLENKSSNTAEYDPNKKDNIINELYKKYGFEDSSSIPDMGAAMTNAAMIEQIKNGGNDNAFQAAVLQRFLQLEELGIQLTSVQTTLNVDSKGIGKSLFEVIEKIETLTKLKNNKTIENADKLIGDIEIVTGGPNITQKNGEGFITVASLSEGTADKVGKALMIRPKTVPGSFAAHGLSAANRAFGDIFPYRSEHVQKVMNEILDLIGKSEISEKKLVEIKQQIFRDIKKYLVTDTELGFSTMNAQQERNRLFFDVVKKQNGKKVVVQESLATFTQKLFNHESERVRKLVRNNRLLSRFQYEINTNGQASIIKFNNAAAENFDEQYLYNSIIELIEANIPLGTFNGKEYTSLNLAQDLVLSSYLEGGIQEAIQYIKYIPVRYLKAIGLDNIIGFDSNERNTLGTSVTHQLSIFTQQYIQHHPQLVKRIGLEDMKNPTNFISRSGTVTESTLKNLMRFSYGDNKLPYISIYNEQLPKGQSKFQLYALDKETGEYVRIPVLGAFGMSEYMAGYTGYKSLVNQPSLVYPLHTGTVVEQVLVTPEEQQVTDRFGVANGVLTDIMDSISNIEGYQGKLATILKSLVSNDTKVVIADITNYGTYNKTTNTITINKERYNYGTDEELVTTLLREAVHSVTDRIISEHLVKFDDPATGLPTYREANDDIPKAVRNLLGIFKEAQKHLTKDPMAMAIINKVKRGEKLKPLDEKTGIDEEALYLNYYFAATDIREFVERMLTTPVLQAELNKVEYRESGMNIAEKFWNWLTDLMNSFAQAAGVENFDQNKVTANALKTIFDMVQGQESTLSSDAAAENTINEVQDDLDSLGKPMSKDQFLGFNEEGDFTTDDETTDPRVMSEVSRISELMEKMRILKVIC